MGDLLSRIGPPALRGYVRLVRATARIATWDGYGVAPGAGRAGPVIWAFWHNRLAGPLVASPGDGRGVMISRSRDGELIARVVAGFGYVPLRGSTSRGGSRALRESVRHLASGRDVVFTPDGPRGPRYRAQPGVAFASRRSGVPVVPVGVGISRKAVFRSWDRFQLPLPFAAIHLVAGRPVAVPAHGPIRPWVERIEDDLARATARADARAGVVPP